MDIEYVELESPKEVIDNKIYEDCKYNRTKNRISYQTPLKFDIPKIEEKKKRTLEDVQKFYMPKI